MSLDALLEVGCEEIPARMVDVALKHFSEQAAKLGTDHQLIAKQVRAVGSPRRLALLLNGLPEQTERVSVEKLGPAAKVAFDAEGKPTKAALGFAKGLQVDPEKLFKKVTDKGEYVAALVETGGVSATSVLQAFFSTLITTIPFAKSMRWGSGEERFNRPVQWLTAVTFKDGRAPEVIPLSLGALQAGARSRGHRFMANEPFAPTSTQDYIDRLKAQHVMVEPSERKKAVKAEAERAAKEAGGHLFAGEKSPRLLVDPLIEQTYYTGLLDEVTNLCERPFGVFGSFDDSALLLPREVVLSTMRGHQRYFAVVDDSGKLLPRFVTIAATQVQDPALVRRGNERVLKARLNDAYYFFNEDQKRTLNSRVPELLSVTYHKKLGTSWHKLDRTLKLAFHIAESLGKPAGSAPGLDSLTEKKTVAGDFVSELGRTVALCKADLVSLMVGEFPELQGIVGGHYARKEGEPESVCQAIAEHYWPRSAEDSLPSSELAAIVALADKLDTIAGIIGIGQPPSGSSDPFALRRAALGMLRIMLARGWNLSMARLCEVAVGNVRASVEAQKADGKVHKNVEIPAKAGEECRAFISERLLNYLLADSSLSANAVRAAMAAEASDQQNSPSLVMQRAKALTQFATSADYAPLMAALKRAANITKTKTDGAVDAARFTHDSERQLLAAITTAEGRKSAEQAKQDADGFLAALRAAAEVRPAVDAFFDNVMVMDKDPEIKANRLRLLQRVVGLVRDLADVEKL